MLCQTAFSWKSAFKSFQIQWCQHSFVAYSGAAGIYTAETEVSLETAETEVFVSLITIKVSQGLDNMGTWLYLGKRDVHPVSHSTWL